MKNKKIIFAGMIISAFAAVVLSANSANASFWNWFKAGDDNIATVASAAAKITLKVEKNGKGTVTSSDGKINCGSKCRVAYNSGISIDLYAKPSNGYTFDKWTGNACGDSIGMGINPDGSITGQCQVVTLVSNENKTITAVAHFKKSGSASSSSKSSSSRSSKSSSSKSSSSKSSRSSATSTAYTLTVFKSGKGYVSDGGKINCGKVCREKYWPGSEVKLTAIPNGGYVFERFAPERECSSIYSGGFGFNDNKLAKQALAYGPAENVVCVTIMNKNKGITAHFKKIPKSSSSSKSKSSSSKSSAPRRSSSPSSN
ncbi:MAG: hypothetical protein UW04_C0061G0004 [Parcubacteria group bacterium GW2011_GWB1_43_8]|nr:MAG: hypothetical protein UW04_C0061G0004 [Parcubacteria group bacterium GW2011_GWB1_43_8]